MKPRSAFVLLPLALPPHFLAAGQGGATPPAPAVAAPAQSGQSAVADPFGAGKGLELTIEAAIALALENNLGLKIEQLSTEVAWYDLRGSWGAFDWNFSAGVGWQDREFQSTSVFGGSKENSQTGSVGFQRPLETGGSFSANFNHENTETDSTFAAQGTSTTDVLTIAYKQPLLRGAWREYATAQQRTADLAWKRQSEHERQVRHKLILDVSVAYWDVVLARAQLEVARSGLDLAVAQLDHDQKRLDAGIGIQLDVFQAETEVSVNEERVLQADLRVRQAGDLLKRLLFPGTEAPVWDTLLVPSTPLREDPTADAVPEWTEALAIAVENRADLRQQRLAIEEAVVFHDVRVNERQGALDLDLSGSSTGFDGNASNAFESALTYEFPTWRAALTYTIPLTNKAARNAEKSAWASLRASRLAYDEIETQAAIEVRESVRQVRYQALAVRATKKSLDLAQRQLAAEQARSREGISTNFEVLRLQRDLTTAMSNERTSRVNFEKAQVALRAAQGLLAEAPKP